MSRLLVATLCLLASHALAASWQLSPQDVDTLVPTPVNLVLVAAAGEPQADAREVARAVEAALQGAGRAKLVMNDSALGPLGAASDEDVRRKATSVPNDVLVIVRTFPQGPERTPVALVVASGPGTTAPRSITLKPLTTPASVVTPPPPPPPGGTLKDGRDALLVEYEALRLHFGQKSLIVGKKTADFVYDEPAYVGTRKLTMPQLFEQLGRKDFLEAWQARSSLKLGLGLGGLGLVLAGGALVVTDFASPCGRIAGSTGLCLQRSGEGLWVAGAITGGVGAVTALVGLLLPQAPSRADVGQAVDEKNAQARRSLGLSSLRLSPGPGQLVVSGRF